MELGDDDTDIGCKCELLARVSNDCKPVTELVFVEKALIPFLLGSSLSPPIGISASTDKGESNKSFE